ncbi:MAG: formate dehydrogenase accessory sulfurtransferase FdhD [Bacteroidota bacterium]|jgi:FdhD protein
MYAISPVNIIKVSLDGSNEKSDLVAVEEPLEIRLGYGSIDKRLQRSVSVTMRTPTHDFELALGFLYSEGIITSYNQIINVKYCVDAGKQATENIVRVELKPEVIFNAQSLQRNFYATSSCGVCGKASIEAIDKMICDLPKQKLEQSALKLNHTYIFNLIDTLSQYQKVFEYTGGLHAAALFDDSGKILLLREDIGRHNALDKLIGNALTQDLLPLNNKVLLMSSRASFELIQKAVMANISIIVTIGAPSSLAIQTAERFGVTLIGFLKNNRFNIYTGKERIE